MYDLTVIILSYNTRDITKRSLSAVIKSLSASQLSTEIIVIDNASTDGSQNALSEFKSTHRDNKIDLHIVCNQENVGFPKGNNQGARLAKGRYILLLNSDALIEKIDFDSVISYMDKHDDIAALTVRVNLQNGSIDPASHRGFPTIWNSICYFTKLEKVTAKLPVLNKLFGGYHLTYLNLDAIHEIDTPSGAFYLCRREIYENLGGFDEDYFMYGEDIDLSYRIKQTGKKIIYYPHGTVVHLKYSSGLKSKEAQKKTKDHFYQAMKIFYKKHYASVHPPIVNTLIYWLIDVRKTLT